MTWPTPQDYNEAIQNPASCFMDQRLKQCSPDATVLGLPRAITGAFATVYRLSSAEKHWAVRCFLQNSPDLPKRYSELSKFVCSDDLPYTVDVHFQPQGIKIRGEWYPILLMEWVDGLTLDQYIYENLENPTKLDALASQFSKMMFEMRAAGIAHGDLQHGNIIIVDEEIRLVDYDGMFVPALDGLTSNELGHNNYQHPTRSAEHFGDYLDNFSAWTILTSINCLAQDSRLWDWLSAGDECLLFRRTDFLNPLSSRSFATLESHTNENVKRNARLMRAVLNYPIQHIPDLNNDIQEVEDLPAVESSPLSAPVHRNSRALPAWINDGPSLYADTNKPRPRGAWPRYEQYQKAALGGPQSFDDPELQVGKMILDDARCGTHGIVFKFVGLQRKLAIKCFLNDVPDREARYKALHNAIATSGLERYFLNFEYLPAGIKVRNYWYPVLKMEWTDALDLEEILKHNMPRDNELNHAPIDLLAVNFATMIDHLHRAGIAHGDLDPSNLRCENYNFRLVDYDCSYVPELAGKLAPEVGNRKYQHPERTLKHFGPALDNYSSWIIDFYIRVAAHDKALWELINMRLKNNEFGDKEEDWTFRFMNLNPDPFVRERVRGLKEILKMHIEDVPTLAEGRKNMLVPPTKSKLRAGLEYFFTGHSQPVNVDDSSGEFGDQSR
jgi:tRNA A-37 threonylcarbamoyl transferase component Bud32